MRAEAQAYADQINSALALLRRFLDWDRALARLDELNARVEDPALWNDPKAAQDVMRERRRLEQAIGATRAIAKELADNLELLEMAEPKAMRAWPTMPSPRCASWPSAPSATRSPLAGGEADPNDTYVEINAGAAALRATTGPACLAACTSAGPSATA
jgi:peptide chain release factor 2